MTSKSKATVIIIVTLLVGITLGFLGYGVFEKNKFHNKSSGHTKEAFIQKMNQIIKPDTSQEQPLTAILERHHQIMKSTMDRHRDEMKALRDSLDSELSTILNQEQKARLKEHRQHFERKKFNEKK